jgi:hypothetical protein
MKDLAIRTNSTKGVHVLLILSFSLWYLCIVFMVLPEYPPHLLTLFLENVSHILVISQLNTIY